MVAHAVGVNEANQRTCAKRREERRTAEATVPKELQKLEPEKEESERGERKQRRRAEALKPDAEPAEEEQERVSSRAKHRRVTGGKKAWERSLDSGVVTVA